MSGKHTGENDMNNTQAKIIAKYNELANKSAKDVTVEVTEHEGYGFVSVMIKAEDPKNWRSGSNTAIFTLGERGGIKHAHYNEDRIYSDSLRLEGAAAVKRIKNADIYLFETFRTAA
tara:strand:+ start:121 stop:471 length:351 start_codon:yes stop_codon:yes gene_type:complete